MYTCTFQSCLQLRTLGGKKKKKKNNFFCRANHIFCAWCKNMVVSKILFQSLAHSISVKSMKQHWCLIIHHSLITTFLNRHFGIIMKRCLPILISDTEIINPSLRTWKILFYWYFHPQYLCFLLLLLPVLPVFLHECYNRLWLP